MSIFTWNSWATAKYADILETAPDQYHRSMWSEQAAKYENYWYYFNRDIFEETIPNSDDDLRYPLGMNMFEVACQNHRACLFGEFDEDVLRFRVRSDNSDASQVEQAINRIWRDSAGNSLLLEQGMLCMILGGAVFRAVWNPVRRRVYIRAMPADGFYPVWNPDDYHQLLEAYNAYYVDATQAYKRYHVATETGENLHLVTEHWTQEMYEVKVDDQLAYWDKEHQYPMTGPNPYRDPLSDEGVIPMIYIPRDRVGEFYGQSVGKNLLTMQDYVNEKLGDVSDAVLEATHKYMMLSGRPAGTKGLEKLRRGKLNNLGLGAPGGDVPKVDTVSAGEIPPGSIEYANRLVTLGRSMAYVPAVAWGEDEGSQRSALTLAFRMWPLSSVVRMTRAFWSDGLAALNRVATIVAANKGGYNLLPRHAEYEVLPVWASMLPRDRAEDVNEVVVRKGANLISVERGLEILEGKEKSWIESEVEAIWADAEKEAEILAASQPQGGFGGGGGSSSGAGPTSVPTS